jgi:hypothetical protein
LQTCAGDPSARDGDTFQMAHPRDYDAQVKDPRIAIPQPILRSGLTAIARLIDPDRSVRI